MLYRVAVTLIPGIGDVLAKNLISSCGGAKEVFQKKKGFLYRIPGIGWKLADAVTSFRDFKRAEKELDFIERHRIRTFYYLDEDYPRRLSPLHDSPALLYFLGNSTLEAKRIIGIIGTRKATSYGKNFIDELIEGLTGTGYLIISGLAYGIDIHAHRVALNHQIPTVGILGHGLDRIYPSPHRHTAQKMMEKGGLLTDFTSGTNPDRENFPRRNRIVAGLCDVLVVVETGISGGSMITAEIANSYNKEIMALPGKVNELTSAGCNFLIKKNKAALLTSATDLLEWMNWDKKKKEAEQRPLDFPTDELSGKILEMLNNAPKTALDDIAFSLQLDPGTLSLRLLELELRNIIRTLPGKYYELVK